MIYFPANGSTGEREIHHGFKGMGRWFRVLGRFGIYHDRGDTTDQEKLPRRIDRNLMIIKNTLPGAGSAGVGRFTTPPNSRSSAEMSITMRNPRIWRRRPIPLRFREMWLYSVVDSDQDPITSN